jgi:LDH2 family malate/lactate/ureidoglycolate dehydrogenase
MLNGYDEAGKKIPYPLGHFFIAINVEEFIDLDRFQAITGDILRQLRASKKAPGCDYIFTPGEKEHLAWEFRRAKGCPVPGALRKDMMTMRDWYQLPYRFEWE